MKTPLRVSTDVGYYEQHSDSVELWSPGGTLFPNPEFGDAAQENTVIVSISELLLKKD